MNQSLELTLSTPAGMTDEAVVEQMVKVSHRLQLTVLVARQACTFMTFPNWSFADALKHNEGLKKAWHSTFSYNKKTT